MTQTPTDALRLVPADATDEMIAAWYAEVEAGIFGVNGDNGKPHEEYNRAAYRALLAAAPASPLPGGGDELTSAREVLDLIERNPVLIGLKGQVSDSLLIETGYVMVDFLKSLPAAPTGEPK